MDIWIFTPRKSRETRFSEVANCYYSSKKFHKYHKEYHKEYHKDKGNLMKIVSAVYWRAGLHNDANCNSVLLKIAEAKQNNFILAIVCRGIDPSTGDIASGYLVEEMMKWYDRHHFMIMLHHKSIRAVKRSLTSALKAVHVDLVRYGEKREIGLGASLVLLAVWRNKYVIMHLGEEEGYKYKRFPRGKTFDRLSQSNKRYFSETPSFMSPKARYGRIRSGEGILLCSRNFLAQLSDRQACDALKPAGLRKEHQISRRLASIADHAGRNGDGWDGSAIYIKFSR